MHWIMTITAACLVGQAPTAPPHAERRTPQPTQPAAGAEARPKSVAAEMVAAMFSSAAEDTADRSLALVEVLRRVEGRAQQVAAVQAYWRLATAVAAFQAALDDVQRVEQLARRDAPGTPAAAGNPAVALAWNAQLAAARARLSEAQVRVTTAQHDLVARAALPADMQPLPTDLPLVGAYKTYYEQLSSAGRPMPVEARLLDRLLPLRREAIELEATALQSSFDLLDALDEVARQPNSSADATTVAMIEALDTIVDRQSVFLAAVERYNDEIAVYAIPLATDGSSAESLASMLVKAPANARTATAGVSAIPAAVDAPNSATPATFNEPTNPSHAPRHMAPQSPHSAEPARATGPTEVRRPALNESSANAGGESLFAGLGELSGARRAQELAAHLHWDRTENPSLGQPMTLEACLSYTAPTDRQAALAAYWTTSRCTAQLQAAADCGQQLTALAPTVMHGDPKADAANQMMRLRQVRLIAESAMAAARCELVAAQFDLAVRTHRPLEGAWPMAATRPHGGGYRVTAEVPSNAPAAAVGAARRAAELLSQEQALLEESASALVLTDAARSAATVSYGSGASSLELTIDTIGSQVDRSDVFLDALARYNIEIAGYVLSVMPAESSAANLAAAMVVTNERR